MVGLMNQDSTLEKPFDAPTHTIATSIAENSPMRRLVLLSLLFLLPALPAHARPVFIEEMTWPEIRQAIASGSDTSN